jgi:hypothetical protein
MQRLFPQFQQRGIKYTGLDIVPEIIEKNQLKFNDPNFNFHLVDLTKGPIPRVDLIITRDCLLHLSYKNILAILTNYKTSGSKYLLVSTYNSAKRKNCDVDEFSVGGRALNLQKPPFNFYQPLQIIVEGCTEGNYGYTDKSLALWDLSKINLNKIRTYIIISTLKSASAQLFEIGKMKINKTKTFLKGIVKKVLFNR